MWKTIRGCAIAISIVVGLAALVLVGFPMWFRMTGGHYFTPSHPRPEHREERRWFAGPAQNLHLSQADMPRLDASTSAEPMLKMAAGTVIGRQMVRMSPPGLRDSMPNTGTSLVETSDVLQPGSWEPSEKLLASLVKASGTHEAYEAVIKNQADLILVARDISADEKKLSEERKVPLEIKPAALDAFVFIVNRHNRVQALTLEQIRAIYAGTITEWSGVGGPRQAINPYRREPNSGSQELMESLVMQGQPMAKPDTAYSGGPQLLHETMYGPFYALLKDRWGLGYTVFYFEENMMYESEVAVCTINGVAPSVQTIRNGTYPLIAPVYVAIRAKSPASSPTRRMRDWLLSPEGQKVIEASGYTSLDSSKAAPPAPSP
jgi:phosphate transport system substrate-binding protein